MKILIKNGKLVTAAEEIYADILINSGKIAQISPKINIKAERVIDATGLLVLPGGIDPHVHLQLPTPAGPSSDNFETGSRAALMGGTTTIIDFVTPTRGQSIIEALNQRKAEATSALTDYSFHISPVEWNNYVPKAIAQCIDMGFPSFKIYMAYKNTVGIDDKALYYIMHTVAQNGGTVTAHCELGDDIEVLRDFYASQGMASPKYHMLTRPPRFESIAVKRAIDLADQTECPLYIVHVSTADSMKHIIQAQRSGQPVFAETCPQYLLLDESLYDQSLEKAIKYVISPPLRTETHRMALWNAIASGSIQAIGTDHCPFTLRQKMNGADDFRKIPNGAGGVEHRLALLYTYGVLAGIINLSKLVDIFATQPAKIFGLYPQKGDLQVGSDADIVVWDPNVTSIISAKSHHSNADISIYEGIKVTGMVRHLFKSGYFAIENGKMSTNLPKGNLLTRRTARTTNQYYKRMDNPEADNCGRV